MDVRVHKDLLILSLKEHPEETLRETLPAWKGTAEEAIAYLLEDPREYLDEFKPQDPK